MMRRRRLHRRGGREARRRCGSLGIGEALIHFGLVGGELLFELAQLKGILLGLTGQRLELAFQSIDARGQVDHRRIGARAFAGGVVGRNLTFEESRAAAGENRTLDRSHFLLQPFDAFADRRVLRRGGHRRRKRPDCRTKKNNLTHFHLPFGPHQLTILLFITRQSAPAQTHFGLPPLPPP